MRFLIAIAIIAGLGFYGCTALKEKKSFLGSAVKDHADRSVKLSDAAERAAARSAEVKPVQTPGLASSAAGASPVGVPAAVPVEPVSSAVYQFKFREPPSVEQLGLQSLGVSMMMDRVTRTVIVRGPVSAVQSAAQFLEALDAVSDSCAVQTWAVYVDRSAQKGFDLVAALRAAAGVQSSLDVTGGGFTLNVGAGDVAAALSAICEGSAVEVVHRPHVRLAHACTARIESTQEIPLPMSTLSNGISQGSIQFRKVGLQLEVTPYFTANDMVRLTVNQTNGILGDAVKIEGSEIPVIQSQTVQTTADLTVGQTVILGGVQTKRLRKVRGLLRDSTEISEGALYVVLSTYSDVPKALPVSAPVIEYPDGVPVPLALPGEPSEDWIEDKMQLLPPLGWEKQERDFVRARGGK